eukprot:9206813-Pyramimonas_sp.AAC.1
MKAAGAAVLAGIKNDNMSGFMKVVKTAQQAEAVRVVVRCRPLSQKETDEGRTRIVDVDTNKHTMVVSCNQLIYPTINIHTINRMSDESYACASHTLARIHEGFCKRSLVSAHPPLWYAHKCCVHSRRRYETGHVLTAGSSTRAMRLSTNTRKHVRHPKGADGNKQFTFDNVYDWNVEQKFIYEDTAGPIVESVMEGYNGTIF